ncbi:glycerophosphodiester phosphodiesterase [Microbacterium sp. zg.Y1090]|uniref:glycerophosphodiester phosphodiesterase family protein n=1 Tax=Microbacterium TaxID=33882 RepID=UPI00214B7D1F|nr:MULTISPECIES: glycerophosphodiester phosphodiesterase family protein [unclassified Microbacterium]MCR2814079.1 glycerophosphodiester phosphodiesterase [Microbacterium sp. zg.Y1084]MCR2817916.1 glycerophosphodiester phosphodiesterase [Microbacterium sp. zg.Y1090]MDL5487770.1 glycerophosphodiester phosphodiesterase family protein [Microbacterium sp. zg-Y1211]WIM27919.1 glycerophosphodiester phosphodiesterase family protein [Microbacterium sp. zg-Y1090]
MPRPRPLVIGHRGAPGYRPEHSRSSYALALELGVDAVEPDVVVSRDGVLIVRHENEIGGTTDVADRPEYAARRTTKSVDGERLTGWFAEDFTAEELTGLRCRERLPALRPASASFDDTQPVLTLRDVLDLVRAASEDQGREIGVVLEVKHATYMSALGWDLAELIAGELQAAGWAEGRLPLIVESFEPTALAQLRATGIRARYVLLFEATGSPFDLVVASGRAAPTYRDLSSSAGLEGLRGEVDGISVDKRMILDPDRRDRPPGAPTLVADARSRGLTVFTWTARPENAFLARRHRGPGGKAAWGDYEAEWRELVDAGVDGVFVDHPDLGVSALRDDGAQRPLH